MRRLSAVLGLLVFGALAPAAVAAPPPAVCPTVTMPIEDVTDQTAGTASVRRDRLDRLERHRARGVRRRRSLGVLDDGVGAGVDMIMVEASRRRPSTRPAASGPARSTGLPVYSDDGKIHRRGGLRARVRPVEGRRARGGRRHGQVSSTASLPATSALRQAAGGPAQGDGRLPAPSPRHQASSGVERLRTPLAVSGLGSGRLTAFTDRLAGHERFYPYAAGAAAAPPAPGDPAEIVPGGNFAAAISYGEITAAGVGTTTLVCDGKVVAFGHPFNFDGPTALSAHTADAILIQDDPLGAPFKLANIGGYGRHARPGPPQRHPRILRCRALPRCSVQFSGQRPGCGPFDEHQTRVNRTQEVPDVAAFHLISNIDGEIDRISGGTCDGRLDRDRHRRRQAVLADTQQQVRRQLRHLVLHARRDVLLCSPSIAQNPFVDVKFDEGQDRRRTSSSRSASTGSPRSSSASAATGSRSRTRSQPRPGSTLRVRALLASGPQHDADRSGRVQPEGAGDRVRRRLARHHGRQRRRWRRRGGPGHRER